MRASSSAHGWTPSGYLAGGLARPRKRPADLTADRGYSCTTCRGLLRWRADGHTIPSGGPRPPGGQGAAGRQEWPAAQGRSVHYRQRNGIERAIVRLKLPAIATSHDKLAVSNHQRGWGFYVATSGNLLMATDSLPARQARPCVRAFVLQTGGCITR